MLALLLGGCSMLGIRTVEEAPYTVVESRGDFELRDYASYVNVETTVDASFDDAGNHAFGKLFGYISGDNLGAEKIPMSAPVSASESGTGEGQSIPMTAPVMATEDAAGWRYAFVLPAGYTIGNAPLPTSPEIRLRQIEPQRVAVVSFSGSMNEAAFAKNLDRLLAWIDNKQLATGSGPRFAGYDPPWTLPFLRRNEIMIDVKP